MEVTACRGPNSERVSDPGGLFSGCVEPDAGRYVLYIAVGCTFSSRCWFVTQFYGLEESVQVVRVFPANSPDHWFFRPESEWEKSVVAAHPGMKWDQDPVMGATHLQHIYSLKPEYSGTPTVPLLFDKKQREIVANDSTVIANALCGKGMRAARTRNVDVELLPAEDDETGAQEHASLQADLHRGALRKVYAILAAKTQEEHTTLSKELFATLDAMERRLVASSKDDEERFLTGVIRLVDADLFNFAIRFELAYRWFFAIGGDSIEGGPQGSRYPAIHSLTQRLSRIEGIGGKEGLTAEIVTGFWLSHSLGVMARAKTVVPLLPSTFLASGEVS